MVLPVPGNRSPWCLKSPVWEWPASRSRREPSEDAARQWRPRLRVYGWCRTQSNDESRDGFFNPFRWTTGGRGSNSLAAFSLAGSKCGLKRSALASGRLLAAKRRQTGEVCVKVVKRKGEGLIPQPLWIADGQLKNTVAPVRGCGWRFLREAMARALAEVRSSRAIHCFQVFGEDLWKEGFLGCLCLKQAPFACSRCSG